MKSQRNISKSPAKIRPSRTAWPEYAVASVVYAILAGWLFTLNRPILMWICVLFAIGSFAGAMYLHRDPAPPAEKN